MSGVEVDAAVVGRPLSAEDCSIGVLVSVSEVGSSPSVGAVE